MKKIFLASAFSSALILSGCGGGDVQQLVDNIVDDFSVTVSGQVTDLNDTPLSGVTIEGVYNNPGDAVNPTASSDANGNYSIKLLKGEAVYLRTTKTSYTAMNSPRVALNANASGFTIGMPTVAEAQSAIDAAYGQGTALADKAWLVVDVINATTGAEVNNQSIAVSASVTPAEVYTACDGSNSGASATVAPPCSADRPVPMYFASFATSTTVTVTVAGETQTAVVRTGEITYLLFEQ